MASKYHKVPETWKELAGTWNIGMYILVQIYTMIKVRLCLRWDSFLLPLFPASSYVLYGLSESVNDSRWVINVAFNHMCWRLGVSRAWPSRNICWNPGRPSWLGVWWWVFRILKAESPGSFIIPFFSLGLTSKLLITTRLDHWKLWLWFF